MPHRIMGSSFLGEAGPVAVLAHVLTFSNRVGDDSVRHDFVRRDLMTAFGNPERRRGDFSRSRYFHVTIGGRPGSVQYPKVFVTPREDHHEEARMVSARTCRVLVGACRTCRCAE